MGLAELMVLAVGLAMDAFAVSLCKGVAMERFKPGRAAVIGTFFGGFQAAMPLVGWLLGRQFAAYITEYDHWIAFGLLLIIGGKMVRDSFDKDEEGGCPEEERLNCRELLVLAVATSIDALAVGITLAFLQVDIFFSVSAIGLTTFAVSFAGVYIGQRFGARLRSRAELLGGAVLIIIGIKILFEHLGLI